MGKKQIDGMELVAVCDLKSDRAKALANLHGVPNYSEMHEMMQKEQVDVVTILTENSNLARHVIELAPYGKHLIVNKPMALRLDDRGLRSQLM